MRIGWLVVGLWALLMSASFHARREKGPEQEIALLLVGQIGSFDSLIGGPFLDAAHLDAGQTVLQRLFLQTRISYKRWEWAAEYFDPALARKLNGEPVAEADPGIMTDLAPGENDPHRFRVTEAEGLQMIEALLFPIYDPAKKEELIQRLEALRTVAGQYRARFQHVSLLPGQIPEAAKMEVFRLLSLGIAGFDAPLSLHAMEESAAALEGIQAAMTRYAGLLNDGLLARPPYDSLMQQLSAATAALYAHPDFNQFDRAGFITRYGNPLSQTLTRLVTEWRLPVIRYNRLLRQDAATLFDRDAFNADAYVPQSGYPTTPALADLGRRLFFEPALSATGKRSCGSCHQPDKAFTDGVPRNTTLDGHDMLPRNTPTLLNAALQPALFDDLRSNSLEAQIQDVLHNSAEMRASLQTTGPHLLLDSGYRRLLAAAFPGGGQAIAFDSYGAIAFDSSWMIASLAAYVRSLSRLNSRFDEYMRGDNRALDADEIKGFNVFMGKGRCGTCHYMPLFNGNFPPMYARIETETIGVPAARGSRILDNDLGRFLVVSAGFLRHSFKTPTVRNTTHTAPYMHNGVFTTLEQVVDFYDDGGGVGEGIKLPNQTLSPDSLHLTATEKADLVKFMRSLDDR